MHVFDSLRGSPVRVDRHSDSSLIVSLSGSICDPPLAKASVEIVVEREGGPVLVLNSPARAVFPSLSPRDIHRFRVKSILQGHSGDRVESNWSDWLEPKRHSGTFVSVLLSGITFSLPYDGPYLPREQTLLGYVYIVRCMSCLGLLVP